MLADSERGWGEGDGFECLRYPVHFPLVRLYELCSGSVSGGEDHLDVMKAHASENTRNDGSAGLGRTGRGSQ